MQKTGYKLSYFDPIAKAEGRCANRSKYFPLKNFDCIEDMRAAADKWLLNFQATNRSKYKRTPRRLGKELSINPNFLKEFKGEREAEQNEDVNPENPPEPLENPQEPDTPVLESVEPEPKIMKIKGDINLDIRPGTGNTTAIIGSSKAGKSFAMAFIYLKYYRTAITTLYSLSPDSFRDNMGKIFKKQAKQIDFVTKKKRTDKQIKELVQKRSPIISARLFPKVISSEKILNQTCRGKYRFANLFDDMIGFGNKTQFNNLILTYRNFNISTVICMQYSNLLSKMSRANFNNLLFFRLNTDEAIEVAIRSFLGGILKTQFGLKNIPEMKQFYKEMTDDFGYILFKPLENKLEFGKL